jgi:hypothetical protein
MYRVTESADERLSWELWRQDDNGIRVLVASFEHEESELQALARFESHQHKQTYWIEKEEMGAWSEPLPN